jgi:hypothetical protein
MVLFGSMRFCATLFVIATIGLVSCPPSWAASTEGAAAGMSGVHAAAINKALDPSSASRRSMGQDANPFQDLDRKFQEDRRKINAVITICRC